MARTRRRGGGEVRGNKGGIKGKEACLKSN